MLTYVPLVKHIVYRKIRADHSLDPARDQVVDPEKCASLEPFLWTRIHGAVLDKLRRPYWAPRSLRRLERDMLKAQETFTDTRGRAPTRAELASMMNMTPAELSDKECEIRRSDLTSLSSLAVTDGESDVLLIDTPRRRSARGYGAQLRSRGGTREVPARSSGSRREGEVGVLLYLTNLTLREIGECARGVGEPRLADPLAAEEAHPRAAHARQRPVRRGGPATRASRGRPAPARPPS